MAEANERSSATPLPVALCLSGGGYRAMLFHAGALLRLCETGWLQQLDLVSSVSGGSITAGQLASQWNMLMADIDNLSATYRELVLNPLLELSRKTIDKPSIAKGFISREGSPGRVMAAYSEHLYGEKTLQQLPDHPRFVFNATNLQSGALWRFSKPYSRDYQVGGIKELDIELATAVTASSAFPPFLSPLILRLPSAVWDLPGTDPKLRRKPYISRVMLADGGIYDNLGLEAAKRSSTLLVSDGGGHLLPVPRPHENWLGQLRRVLAVEDNQVRALRKRTLIDHFEHGDLKGTYWGIRTDVATYCVADALPCPHQETMRLAAMPTRLAPPPGKGRFELVNWGYAVCDAALRKRVDPTLSAPTSFPFPTAGVSSRHRRKWCSR